jgi:penicillin-binding protein 1A
MAKAQGVRLWLVRLFKIGAFSAAAGLIALVAAVIVAMQSLPSYESLKSSPNGQMIRVHAADGSVIVSLGPSFGRWLTIDQIPQVMKDAMVSVEDKRFYYHPGVDPVGMARAGWFAIQHRGTGGGFRARRPSPSSSPATSSSTTAIPSDARRGR